MKQDQLDPGALGDARADLGFHRSRSGIPGGVGKKQDAIGLPDAVPGPLGDPVVCDVDHQLVALLEGVEPCRPRRVLVASRGGIGGGLSEMQRHPGAVDHLR